MSRLSALSGHERRVLAATCLGSLGSFYSMAVMGIALPQIQRGLAISEGELGALFAVARFGNLFSLALAIAADRMGRRRLLIASVAGCALANLATAFAQSGPQLATLQLVTRCFIGAQLLLAGVVVSEELSAEHRGWGIGVLSAVGGMGGAVALLVFAFVDQIGWRALFVVGGLGLLGLPWLYRSLHETRRFSAQANASSVVAWQPLRDLASRYGWRLAAVVGIVAPVCLILEPGSVLVSKHLQDDLGYSPGGVGILMGLCGSATPLGNMLSGAASDRLGRRPVTIAISILLSVGVALFYNGKSTVALAIGLALLFFTMGGVMVLHMAIATELFPTGFRSTAAGLREAVATIGASAGMWILSLLYGATGSHAASITWMLLVTPIAPLVLLFLPETAGRELEEIAPDRARAS